MLVVEVSISTEEKKKVFFAKSINKKVGWHLRCGGEKY
jgi:hypothetical protein